MPREKIVEAKSANDNSHFLNDHISTITDRVAQKEEEIGRACARSLAELKSRADAGDADAQRKWKDVVSALPDICQASEAHSANLLEEADRLVTIHTESAHADGLASDGLTHIRKLSGAQEKYEMFEWDHQTVLLLVCLLANVFHQFSMAL